MSELPTNLKEKWERGINDGSIYKMLIRNAFFGMIAIRALGGSYTPKNEDYSFCEEEADFELWKRIKKKYKVQAAFILMLVIIILIKDNIRRTRTKLQARLFLYLCNGFAKAKLYFWLECLCSDTLALLF